MRELLVTGAAAVTPLGRDLETTAARLASALDSLQILWRQCGKSRYRKTPETREQEDFVRAWPSSG